MTHAATLRINDMIPNPCATLQGKRIRSVVLKTVLPSSPYLFTFPNAVWASVSYGFRLVSDTLVGIEIWACSTQIRQHLEFQY